MSDDFVFRCAVVAAFFASCLFLLFFPAFVTALWERRLVWPYILADEYEGKLPPLTKVAGAANDALAARGFARVDALYDGKGRGYRFRYDFWLSADGAVLAVVGGGRLFGGRVESVWLLSRLADGRYLETANNLAAAEYDLTGLRPVEVAEEPGMDELLARHAERLRAGGGAVPYPAGDPLAAHAEMLRRRVARLVAGGYAGYLDDEETAWRYSAKGAALVTVRTIILMVKVVVQYQRRSAQRGRRA